MEKINGISKISNLFDVFIFDIWGVIFNGHCLFPYIKDVFSQLKKLKKTVFVLSNAPKRSSITKIKLESIGLFDFDGIMTAGEDCYKAFLSEKYKNLGRNYYHVGYDNLLDGLNLIEKENIDDSDFILVTGYDEKKIKTCLDIGIKKNIPMICANHDRIVVRNDDKIFCAGEIQRIYQLKGGITYSHGKPSTEVFQRAHEEIDKIVNIEKNKILMIGDSMETDIKGAIDYGICSLLVRSGVHEMLKKVEDQTFEFAPNYIVNEVIW